MDFHIFGGRDHHLVKSALFTFSVNLCSHTEDKNYGLITKIKHRKKKKKKGNTLQYIFYTAKYIGNYLEFHCCYKKAIYEKRLPVEKNNQTKKSQPPQNT